MAINRKQIKEYLEILYFHGYINHDITKLDNLIDDYFPEQCEKANNALDIEQLACIHDVTRLRLIGRNIICLDCKSEWVKKDN
jgi:hypothetical protein